MFSWDSKSVTNKFRVISSQQTLTGMYVAMNDTNGMYKVDGSANIAEIVKSFLEGERSFFIINQLMKVLPEIGYQGYPLRVAGDMNPQKRHYILDASK